MRKFKPTFVILVDTHASFAKVQQFWFRLGYSMVELEESSGHAGVIWILTNDDKVVFQVLEKISYVITFEVCVDGRKWACSAVYTSLIPTIHSSLWDYLIKLWSGLGRPWLVMGDFNEVCLASELKGCSFIPSRACLFNDYLNCYRLANLHVVEGKFTWQRSVHGHNV